MLYALCPMGVILTTCYLQLTTYDWRTALCSMRYAVCWFGLEERTPEQLKGEGG